MAEKELQSFFDHLLTRVPGLQAALLTDRDGVVVLKAALNEVPPKALNAGFLASFGTAIEQASKLGYQKNKSVACLYDNFQTVHFNHLPLILTLVATSDANTGVLLSLEKDLSNLIAPIAQNFINRAAELDLN